MGNRLPGSGGTPLDYTTIDAGTSIRARSTAPGISCVTRDQSLFERSGFVLDAWEIAKARYAGQAIIAHTEEDFHGLIEGAIPMLLAACGGLLATTLAGAGIGSLFGGVGAAPGAALGFSFGTTVLEVLGLGFLIIFIVDRLGAIAGALGRGVALAWDSSGEPRCLDEAARSMADGVGLFYAALLQALLMYLGSALASRTLSASRAALRGSRLFQSCEKLEAWINENFADLYRKHIGKEPPGILPPITLAVEEWLQYVKAIELKPPPNRGMLWSKLGGGNVAKALADSQGLTSLETLLEQNGFQAAYDETFGKNPDWDLVKPIWKALSEKYARSLNGRVVAFVDDAKFTQAIRDAPVTPLKDLQPGEMGIGGPLLTNELMVITDVMEKNPSISVVEVRDASSPQAVIKLMTRDMVLQSKAAPLQ